MDAQKTLGQIIEEKRNQAGYSQAELADIMPFSGWLSNTVSMLEGAGRNLTLEEAVYLAKVLGCSLEELAAPFTEEAQDWNPITDYAEKQEIRAEIEKLQKTLRGMDKK